MGLVEIAGYYKNLKKGFQQIDADCTYVNLSSNKFLYGDDDTPTFIVKWMKQVISQIRLNASQGKKVKQMLYTRLLEILKVIFFIWTLCNFDVFIMGFGSSFFGTNLSYFRHWDLPILKFFNKKVIFTFHGSDSRPPFMDGTVMTLDGRVTIEKCIQLTAEKKKYMSMINKYADVIIDIPPQGIFHECPFVLNLFVGLPYSISNTSIVTKADNIIRILHAPSNPEAKGTSEIRQAIENLKKKGYEIEFNEIIGLPNSVVLEQLAACDIVVDQVYADYGMPGLATESAWYGKPVIIGGYAKKMWQNLLPENKLPPTYYCDPDGIEEAIEKLILDEKYRLDLGQRAKEFVQNEWSVDKIAKRYIDLINGDIPEDWLYDPNQTSYVHGCCLHEERVKEVIKEIVMHGGVEALQLKDKPELEKKMLVFAGLK